MTPSPPRSRLRVLAVSLCALALALVLIAVLQPRSIAFWIKAHTGGSAWFLTYEATSANGRSLPNADVRFGHDADRFKERYEKESLPAVRLPWRKEVIVNTGNQARLEVVPDAQNTAACRILLDGIRVVATATSPAPGKPAVCRVTTPSTPEHWPR